MSRTSARALVIAAALACLCFGCNRKAADEDVSGLEITRYRINVDDAHRVARVMGEVRNDSEHRVNEAVVIGKLRGPGEEQYGSGRTEVRDIPPNEAKLFSLRIDARGAERDVEFYILSPSQAQSSAQEDSADK